VKPRSELKSFCCTRVSRNVGPIRVRVICSDEQKHAIVENDEDKENQVPLEQKRRGPKRRAIKEALNFSSPNPSQVKSNDAVGKTELAVLTEDRLKLESLVKQLSEVIKTKDEEARYLRKQMQPFVMHNNTVLHVQFKKGIERLAATIFPVSIMQ
jgi:hypothetical protein